MNLRQREFNTPVDVPRFAAAVSGPDALLFERFGAHDRRRETSLIALRWSRVKAATFAEALAMALRHGAVDDNALHFVMLGAGGGNARELGDSWAADAFLVARLDEAIEIDHKKETLRYWYTGAASLSPIQLERALQAAVPDSSTSPAVRTGAGASWTPDCTAAEYEARVQRIQRGLAERAVHGAVLSLAQSRNTGAQPLEIYRQMTLRNPSTYGICWSEGNLALIGSSPLAYMEVERGMLTLETDAGTRPVSGDAVRDQAASEDLMRNPKDLAEHSVVVDAEFEALAPLAEFGRIERPVDREVRRFSHVMHLYTVLQAELKKGMGMADAVLGVFPPAAVSGYPKRAALQLGTEVEGGDRGPYGGVAGIIRGAHSARFAVVIRSLWREGSRATLRTGGKVVPASVPAEEYREALAKARFIVESVDLAEQLAKR